ncbi:GIY-YIG nuclease family protein [Caballeronia sp. LZ033]|uniref:GIY-YIG nuclease family protein n=1 Tax=Caballeronia sp. LZ033 TaxID=3038566 RepID=UPI002864CA86|nr:GIY-YIG nuclease family protein [Caballeronia sp. LZ033]MDR5813342.1 GIY-YIG nuclease family protein [Caballeronia sp. LZ033]
MSYGFVYILANSAMPNLYKVGFTERSLHARCEEPNRATGVPSNFEIVCYAEYVDARTRERAIHAALADLRDSSNREFFCGDLKRISHMVIDVEEAASVCEHQLPFFLLQSASRRPRAVRCNPANFRGFD